MSSQNFLLFKKKLGVSGSLLILWGHTGNGIYSESGSQPLLPISTWVFSHLPIVQESCCWILGLLSKRLFPSVAAYSECLWKEGSLEASHVTILVDVLSQILFV